jgi:virulence-associated protein VapD
VGQFDADATSMLVVMTGRAAATPSRRPTQAPAVYAGRVYAIAFDMDTGVMEREYGNPNWRKGYAEIGAILLTHGFDDHKQGSVYFGDRERVTAVSCVVAVQDLARQLPWFSAAVRDIRMLRIEEEDDLGVAIQRVEPAPSTGQLFEAPRLVE